MIQTVGKAIATSSGRLQQKLVGMSVLAHNRTNDPICFQVDEEFQESPLNLRFTATQT